MSVKAFRVVINGVAHEVQVEEIHRGADISIHMPAVPKAVAPVPAAVSASAASAPGISVVPAGSEIIRAPLQGTILDVRVNTGQTVKAGQVLVIIEAMKMENEVLAPRDCTVTAVMVTKGIAVASGEALVCLG